MTTLRTMLTTALSTALPNTWYQELPPAPTWPAAVFEVQTEPESGWVAGAEYYTHDVRVCVLGTDADAIDTHLIPTILAALEAMPEYQYTQEMGDVAYEPDPRLYGRYVNVRLRTRGRL